MDNTRDEIRLDTSKVDRARVILLAIAMIIAALLPIIGLPLTIDEGANAQDLVTNVSEARGRFLASNLTGALLAMMLAVSAFGFMLLARVRGAVLMTVGGVLMVVGGMFFAAGLVSFASAAYLATAPGFPRADAVALLKIVEGGSVAELPFYIGGPALLLGSLLVGVALIVARSVRLWIPIAWLVGTVLLVVVPGTGLVGLLTAVPFSAALVGSALALPNAALGGTRATIRLPSQAPRHADETAHVDQAGG